MDMVDFYTSSHICLHDICNVVYALSYGSLHCNVGLFHSVGALYQYMYVNRVRT